MTKRAPFGKALFVLFSLFFLFGFCVEGLDRETESVFNRFDRNDLELTSLSDLSKGLHVFDRFCGSLI